MYIFFKAILMSVINFVAYHVECSLLKIINICNRHFLPYGRTDLNDRVGGRLLHCIPRQEVVYYNFMGRCFAVAATSARG
jgi:hypothetical protein